MAEKKVIEIEIKDNSKTLKTQYREALEEVQKLVQAFGETSVEVAKAAKKAAELKDQIEDTNDAIAAFKGEGTFNAFGKSVSSVASGFSAVEGAMGLVGVESENVQEAMLRVQSAMALAQGLEGLEDAGRAFKQLGAVVKSTTIFTTAYNFVMGISNKETADKCSRNGGGCTCKNAQSLATTLV
jgi:enamine deaminase RidA (YjgF/YER057c/UK114 family)